MWKTWSKWVIGSVPGNMFLIYGDFASLYEPMKCGISGYIGYKVTAVSHETNPLLS